MNDTPYKLRFVQRFQEGKRSEFLALERKFQELERTVPEFPKGRRYQPYSGREPANTLIWECEFPTLEALQETVRFLEGDPRHERLYKKQCQYFQDAYMEIYRGLEL